MHGIEHVAAGQVDGGGAVEIQIDIGPLGGNDGANHARHIAAGQIVRFQAARGDSRVRIGADAGLHAP